MPGHNVKLGSGAARDVPPPNIFLSSTCNHDCLFCSEGGIDNAQTPDQIREVISMRPDTLSIEGGEPTLSRKLPEWVRLAREAGVRDIILCTNGVRFEDASYVKELCKAGVTLFNVNFPSHIEKVFDTVTRTRGQFKARLKALRGLIDAAGGQRVRLNCVVHSLSYMTLEDYARFVNRHFPEVYYVEFNMIKDLGYVMQRHYLVPRLSDLIPRLTAAMALMDRLGMKYICDGFPLCLLPGREYAAIDTYKRMTGNSLYMGEKKKSRRCAGCSLGELCAGLRGDYMRIHGDGEIRASTISPAPIKARIRKMFKR
ncbi:MAG: radical SAM protein [Elusimicrobiota bacterium]